MAIDIRKGLHNISFPNKIASMLGAGTHVYNIVLQADADNGILAGRGDYVHYDQYEQDAPSNSWAGVIRDVHADGTFEVETTALPSGEEVLYIYNAPVSEYGERELQDESLFFNKAGEVAQGAVLSLGDVFTVSANGFNGTPAVGATLTFANGKYVI